VDLAWDSVRWWAWRMRWCTRGLHKMRRISGLAEELLVFQLVFLNGICIGALTVKTEEHTNKRTILQYKVFTTEKLFRSFLVNHPQGVCITICIKRWVYIVQILMNSIWGRPTRKGRNISKFRCFNCKHFILWCSAFVGTFSNFQGGSRSIDFVSSFTARNKPSYPVFASHCSQPCYIFHK
jgi:hypothetical protein